MPRWRTCAGAWAIHTLLRIARRGNDYSNTIASLVARSRSRLSRRPPMRHERYPISRSRGDRGCREIAHRTIMSLVSGRGAGEPARANAETAGSRDVLVAHYSHTVYKKPSTNVRSIAHSRGLTRTRTTHRLPAARDLVPAPRSTVCAQTGHLAHSLICIQDQVRPSV